MLFYSQTEWFGLPAGEAKGFDMDYDNLGICETCGDRYVLRPATVCWQCAAQRTIDDDVPTGDDATPFTLTTDSDEQ